MFTSPFRRAARLVAPAFAALALVTTAAAAPPADITGLAPSRSFLVVSVPNFKALQEAAKKTELGKLWDEPAVRDFFKEVAGEVSEGFTDFVKSVDPTAQVTPPEGQLGLALFTRDAPVESGKPLPDPYVLVAVDWGEKAADYEQFLEKVVDRGVQEKKVTAEHDTYQGVPVTIVRALAGEKPEKANKGGENPPEDEDAEEAPPKGFHLAGLIGGTAAEKRAVRVARVDNVFILSTDQHAFEDALDAQKGRAIDSLAEAAAFRQSLDQHPGHELAFALFRLDSFLEMVFKAGGHDPGEPDFSKVFGAMGLTGIKTISVGLRLDSPDGMIDLSLAALVPEKKGFLELVSPAGAFEPPAFVPADAAGVSRLTFDFSRLFQVIRSVLGEFPDEVRSQIAPSVEMARDMINPALQAMGPVVHLVSSYVKPLGPESARTTFVIDLKDQEAVANTLGGIVAKLPGNLEPNEFEGNTIYKAEFPPVAIGIGFNRLFIGAEAAVQAAMRLAGHPEGQGLAGDPAFKEGTRALAPGALAYSWADVEQDLRWQYWTVQNQNKMLEQQLISMGMEPEQRADYLKRYGQTKQPWIDKLPPVETVLPHLGDIATELRATPEGFQGRMLMLRPRERK